MTKHSQEEWAAKRLGNIGGLIYSVITSGDKIIGWTEHEPGDKCASPDAAMMVAGPEMFVALTAMVEAYGGDLGLPNQGVSGLRAEAFSKALKAIVKAQVES